MNKCVVDGVEYVATPILVDDKTSCAGCAAERNKGQDNNTSLCLSLDSCFEEDNDGAEAIWVRAE